MRKFTRKEDNFLKRNYLSVPAKTMSRMLKRSESCARQRMKLLGIVVPPEVIQKFREQSYFKKGNVSRNKGLKQTEYMSAEAIARCSVHRFKAGHKPKNTCDKDGEIRIRKDSKTGIPYQYIRVSIANWKELHRYNWEKENGPIPKGMVVAFKNGNSLKAENDNLELITMAENMRRNTIQRYPPDVQLALKRVSKLKKLINEKQNNGS